MRAVSIAQMVVRITGTIQLLMGFVIWPGIAGFLIPVHILLGLVLVIALLTLAYLANRSGISAGLVILTVVWALALPVVGFTQENLLPETGHWIIQVVHLLLGIGAIGIGELLGAQIHKKV
jgi:hypothetical protein